MNTHMAHHTHIRTLPPVSLDAEVDFLVSFDDFLPILSHADARLSK